MYKIEEMTDSYGYPVYRMSDGAAGNSVCVNALRGGIPTQLVLGGKDILHLDGAVYRDREKYIRGGIPVLFPSVGKLKDDTYREAGREYHLPIHGLARNFPWKVTGQREDTGELTLELESTEETKKQYPFAFRLRFTYLLGDGSLKIRQEYQNLSEKRMPFSAGFHPYFRIPEQVEVRLHAQSALNTVTGRLGKCPERIPCGEEESGYLVLDGREREVSADFGTHRLTVAFDGIFRYLLVWYVEKEKFICLEPWTGRPDALNTGEDLLRLEPGECLNTWVEIRLEQ